MAKVLCQCGCGEFAHPSSMTDVVIEEATDNTLRQTRVKKRYLVRNVCQEPFEIELGLQNALRVIIAKWYPRKASGWAKFKTPYRYCRRVNAAVHVMSVDHRIFERTKGFDWARRHAIKTAVLFGCPVWMQAFLVARFQASAKRRNARAAAREREPRDAAPA